MPNSQQKEQEFQTCEWKFQHTSILLKISFFSYMNLVTKTKHWDRFLELTEALDQELTISWCKKPAIQES